MRPSDISVRDHQRHHVLELIAKAVRAARLIKRRSRPDAAGQRLVEQPAVEHDVHAAIRRLDLHRAENVVPGLGDCSAGSDRGLPPR